MRPLAQMMQGKAEFNQQYVAGVGKSFAAVSIAYTNLFPEGSDVGGKTEASPKIFLDRSGFVAAAANMHAAANVLSTVQDTDGLKAAFAGLRDSCKSCHNEYRVEK